MGDELLNQIVEMTGAEFLSQLHGEIDRMAIYAAVEKLAPADYSLEAWQCAIRYIVGKALPDLHSSAEAVEYLERQLKSMR